MIWLFGMAYIPEGDDGRRGQHERHPRGRHQSFRDLPRLANRRLRGFGAAQNPAAPSHLQTCKSYFRKQDYLKHHSSIHQSYRGALIVNYTFTGLFIRSDTWVGLTLI